jgi:hypothetical protein
VGRAGRQELRAPADLADRARSGHRAREGPRRPRAGRPSRIDAALAAGDLSYAKVRALTRIATADNEEQALATARAATGAQLERICRRFRRASDAEREMAENRCFRARVLGDGLVDLEIVVTSDEADLIVKAVDRARERMEGAADAPLPTAADGLVDAVSSYLADRGAAEDRASAPAPRSSSTSNAT